MISTGNKVTETANTTVFCCMHFLLKEMLNDNYRLVKQACILPHLSKLVQPLNSSPG